MGRASTAHAQGTLKGKAGRRPAAGAESLHMIVLGVDPGVANTGYGVVARRADRLVALDGGVIRTPAGAAPERRLAHRRDVAQGLGRHRRAVADVAAQHDHVVGSAHGHLASQQRDQRATRSSAADSGAQLTWQIATARASAA